MTSAHVQPTPNPFATSKAGTIQRKSADPSAYRVVSVRLREAEYLSFAEQIAPLGISNNLAMRIAARRIAGFLEVDPQTREHLISITAQIGEISANISALSEVAQQSGTVDMDKLTELRIGFGSQFAKLDAQLQTILNVSKRRQDGQAMLIKAAR